MKIYLSYIDPLSRVASLVEDIIRANSDIKFAIYQKSADLTLDFDFTHPTGKNTLHVVFYDRDPVIKSISDNIYESAKDRDLPADYGKIDNRIKAPQYKTVYIKLGRAGYEFNENTWASAIAEGLIRAVEGTVWVEDPKSYTKPSVEKTIFDRNFAQEPTRNSDIIFGR